jgi:hypothetical protein
MLIQRPSVAATKVGAEILGIKLPPSTGKQPSVSNQSDPPPGPDSLYVLSKSLQSRPSSPCAEAREI